MAVQIQLLGHHSSHESGAWPLLTRVGSVCLITSFEESSWRCGTELDPKLKKSFRGIGASNTAKIKQQTGIKLLSSSGFGEVEAEKDDEGCFVEESMVPQQNVVAGGCGGGRKGGGACGSGRRSDDGSGSDPQNPGGWHRSDGTAAYYEKMIEANPGNPLLLSIMPNS